VLHLVGVCSELHCLLLLLVLVQKLLLLLLMMNLHLLDLLARNTRYLHRLHKPTSPHIHTSTLSRHAHHAYLCFIATTP